MPTPPLSDAVLQEVVDAREKYSTLLLAAKSLNMARKTFEHRLNVAHRRGIGTHQQKMETLHGYNPQHDLNHVVPSPLILRGTSTLYDEDGKAKLQWVKTKLDDERVDQLFRESLKALSDSISGLAPLTDSPTRCMDDLLAVYPLGDPHFGMYAWAKESGADFDADIAKQQTLAAIDRLVNSAPAASTAIILPLGDVFHADNQSNVTPGHKNQLDVDTRFVKVLGIGIQAFRHVILRALQKHDKVIVRFVAGNHDPHSIWALAFTISAYFDNEPRVEVDLSPSLFWYYKFGKVLIGSTHGDTVKPEQLLGVMASDRSEDWGDTKHRYWYTGHIHTSNKKEFNGVIWESFRTLAASDAWAAGRGYRAGRDMLCIVHHKDFGEVERHRCDIGMIT